MSTAPASRGNQRRYELRFAALFYAARDFAFPCDAQGNVDTAGLSERARASYQRVRAAVGREFLCPVKCLLPA